MGRSRGRSFHLEGPRLPPLTERLAGALLLVVVVPCVAAAVTRSVVWFGVGPLLAWVSIAFHELGHVGGGLLTGHQLVAIRVGEWPSLTVRSRGPAIRVGPVAATGMTLMLPGRSEYARWRSAVMVLGGPLATVAVLAATLPGLGQSSIAGVLFAINLVLLSGSLIPATTHMPEGAFQTDMSRLLAIRPGQPVAFVERVLMAGASSLDPTVDAELTLELTTLALQSDDPRDRPMMQNLAAYTIVLLCIESRYSEAEALASAALASDPTSDAFADTLGMALAVNGRSAEAIPMLERGATALIGLGLGSVHGAVNSALLARVYADHGDGVLARSHLDRARDLGCPEPLLASVTTHVNQALDG